MQHIIKYCALFVFVISLTGCFSTQSLEENPDLDALIVEILKHNDALKEKQEARLNQGILLLEVTHTDAGYVLSAELDEASIRSVIRRIFENVPHQYVVEDVSLYGTVSAWFSNLPLIEALDRIVRSIGLTAQWDDSMVVITQGPGIAGVADDEIVYREVVIRNLSIDAAGDLLGGIFPPDINGNRTVNFGKVATSNSVYLYGAAADVGRAVQLLTKADRVTPHVSIEVLVVEFNQGDREEYESNIKKFVEDEFTLNSLVPGSIDFDWTEQNAGTQSNPTFKITNVTGVVEMLISDQKARLVSRPFIATLSGTEAQIKIVSERFVEFGSGDSLGSTDVESGVTLQITPTVLADGRIRMEVSVEDSQFSGVNVANILTEVNRNSAETVMHVNDGQTIVVGGLMLDRRSWSNSGFPFLRHIPLLNLLTASQNSESNEKEVTIYITPRIWEPNYIEPLIGVGTVGINEKTGIMRK
jgi:type II secretory pathway component GspD/PulD (secretin)